METKEHDVIVVGAGISGLTAAYVMKQRDPHLDILLIEAKDRVGGRTLTVDMKSKDGTSRWDLGGQWVGRCQPHIMALLEELGLETYPQYISGRKFMQVGSGSMISSYVSDIPTMSFVGLVDLYRLLKVTDKMASEVDPEDPFVCRQAELWDSTTLESFIDARVWSASVKDLMRSAMRTMFGTELSQISLLYFLTYVSSAGNIKNLIEATEGTAQEFKIKHGAQQVSERLAEKLGSSSLHLEEAVLSIEQTSQDVIVTTESLKTHKRHVYKCQKVILAIPPCQIGKLHFMPPLPSKKREIVKRMPPSNIIKFIATYPENFWREAGQSGEVVTNGGSSLTRDCDVGPVGIVYDATSCDGQPALLGFIGGLQGVQWQEQSEEVRRSAVLKSLSEFFGPKVHSYVDYREKIWDLEPYNEGAPVSAVGPGAMRYYATGLRAPFKNVHFAGTESATVWCGFMNGAVQAGQRAAIEVMYDLRPQLVTSADIQGLRGARKGLKKSKSTRRKIAKWTVRIGFCVLIVYAVRKAVHAASS